VKKSVGLFSIVIISIFFLFFYYGEILKAPNSYLFTDSGDAIKNYYTYAYHNVNDSSCINFEGLNYPYGEHFLYTDCHPIFTVLIKSLSSNFPKLVQYQIGIINFLMIFSILITSVLVWLILVKYKVNPIYSVLPAIGITIMQPQLFRLLGHFALSYSFFIPLTWLLLLKYKSSKRKMFWSFVILINNVILFFVHGYLGMIAVSFLLSYFIFDIILNLKIKYKSKILYAFIFIQTILPLIIFRLFISFTDTHVGRTDNPWGFFSYRADYDTIFLAHHPPLNPILHKLMNMPHQTWEGWAYIGLTSMIAIVTFFVISINKSIKGKRVLIETKYLNSKSLQTILLASILTLLFSMALPFRMYLEFLVDWFPAIKQFRSIGRFAWIFYFVITISSSIYFFNYGMYLLKGKRKIIAFVLFLLPVLFIIEGNSYHQSVATKLTRSVNLFDKKQLKSNYNKAINKIDSKKYQAIFPLPFYYINSDYGKTGTEKIYKTSMVLSYHLNLPIQGSYLGRTGIFEAKKIKQLLSPAYYHKIIKNDIKDNRPYLLVYTNEELNIYEQNILDRATKIYENDNLSLYTLSVKDLFKNTAKLEIEDFYKIKSKLFLKDNFLFSDTSTYYYYNNFEEISDTISFLGKGAFSKNKEDYSTLAKIPPSSLQNNKKYIVSFWMYNWGRNFGQGVLNSSLFIEEKSSDGKLSRIADGNPTQSCVIKDKWSLIELEFQTNNVDSEIRIVLKGGNNPAVKIHVDNLLIREAKTNVYKIISNDTTGFIKIFKNNQIIKLYEK